MKKLIISVLIASAALVSSCKKDDKETSSPVTPTCRVTAGIDSLTKDTSFLKLYDSQGRLIKNQLYSKNVRADYSKYTYGNSTVTEFDYDKDGNITDTTFFFLNQDGTVMKDANIQNNPNSPPSYDTNFYAYENGYLKSIIFKFYSNGGGHSDTLLLEYVGGNLTLINQIKNGKTTYTTEYTYSTQPDKLGITDITNNTPVSGLYGKGNVNLIKTETFKNIGNPSDNYVSSYIYTLDTNDVPIQVVIKKVSGNGNHSNTLITTHCK